MPLPIPTKYCERITEGILAEPLNLFSNLTFIGAAWFAWNKLNKSKVIHREYLLVLVVLLALTGLGSMSYHSMRSGITLFIDVGPEYVFMLGSLVLLLWHLVKSWKIAGAITAGFASILVLLSLYIPSNFLNGSVRHVTILIFIIILAIWCYRKFGRIAYWLPIIAGTYGIAIFVRSLDNILCSTIPVGTHFLWHIFAGLASYLTASFLIDLDRKH